MPSNTALLREVRQVVADNPERHNQNTWISSLFGSLNDTLVEEVRQLALQPLPGTVDDYTSPACGTTGCVAGWASVLAAPKGSVFRGMRIEFPDDGGSAHVSQYAEKALGLSDGQAIDLFSPDNSREYVLKELDYLIEHPDDDRASWER